MRVDPKEGLLVGYRQQAPGDADTDADTDADADAKKKKKKKKQQQQQQQQQGGVVGAYIPLARLATPAERGFDPSVAEGGEKVKMDTKWKIEKEFKVGDELRCRIVAANLFEGLAIATAIPEQVREREKKGNK